jgi:quercetin dioxygenase-like cupin family protein
MGVSQNTIRQEIEEGEPSVSTYFQEERMSYFKDARDRDPMTLVPGAITRTFWGDNILLSLVEIEANSEVPRHTHPHEQAGVLIEGEMEMGIGGEVRVMKPGDMYIIPANVEHYARCGDTSAKALDIFSPVREEFKY